MRRVAHHPFRTTLVASLGAAAAAAFLYYGISARFAAQTGEGSFGGGGAVCVNGAVGCPNGGTPVCNDGGTPPMSCVNGVPILCSNAPEGAPPPYGPVQRRILQYGAAERDVICSNQYPFHPVPCNVGFCNMELQNGVCADTPNPCPGGETPVCSRAAVCIVTTPLCSGLCCRCPNDGGGFQSSSYADSPGGSSPSSTGWCCVSDGKACEVMSLDVCSNGKIAFAQNQATCDILCAAGGGSTGASSVSSDSSGTSSSNVQTSSSASSSSSNGTSDASSSYSSSSAAPPSVCSLFECALGGNDECITLGMGCNQLTAWPCWRCQGLCGNHKLDYPEKCDDGNTSDGDGCSATCEIEDSFCAQGGAGQLNSWQSGGGMSPIGSSLQSSPAGAQSSPSGPSAPSGSMAVQAGPGGSIVTTVGCLCSSELPWQSMNCSIRALNAGSEPVRVSRVSAELPSPMHFAAEQRPGWPYMTLWAPDSSIIGEATADCGRNFDWQNSACNRLDWSVDVTIPPGGYLLTVVGVLNFPQQGSGPLAVTVTATGQPDSHGSAAAPTAVCR